MAPSGEANVAVYRLASVYSPPLDSITQFWDESPAIADTATARCSLKRCRLRPCAPSN